MNDLEPTFALDLERTKRVFTRGVKATIGESAQFLQKGKRRVRDIRAEQIERILGTKTSVFKPPHPCLQQDWRTYAGNIPRNEKRRSMW